MAKGDVGVGPVGVGVDGKVGASRDPCDHGKKFAKAGANLGLLFYSPQGEIGRETDEDGNNWHGLKPETGWQESIPTDKNTWMGNWIPKAKERAELGGFAGPYLNYTF